MQPRIYIYTDASFSNTHKLAVIGYARFGSSYDHDTIAFADTKLQIHVINEKNNIRAELRGAIMALAESFPEALKGSLKAGAKKDITVVLYTDCRAVVDLPSRREKLEHTEYISQSKGTPLANADLYREFFLIFDQLQLELIWVKGHCPGKDQSKTEKNFSYLDKKVRGKLREVILSNSTNK